MSSSLNLSSYILVPKDSCPKDEKTEVKMDKVLALTPTMVVAARSKGRKSKKSLAGDGIVWSVVSQGMPHIKLKFPDNKPFKIVQTTQNLGIITSSNTIFSNFGNAFSVSNLNQIASLQNLFDQYRIDLIECWIQPRNPSSSAGSATLNRGLLYSVIDYDNSTATSFAALDYESYSNCVVSSAVCGQYRKFQPHTAVATFQTSGASFTGYQNETNQWIDSAYPTVQHYALKVGVSTCDVAADEVSYDLITRYTVSWRNVI